MVGLLDCWVPLLQQSSTPILEQMLFQRLRHCLAAGVHVQLDVNIFHVRGDGERAEKKHLGNLLLRLEGETRLGQHNAANLKSVFSSRVFTFIRYRNRLIFLTCEKLPARN